MRIYTHARVNVRLLQKSPQELNIELPGVFSYSTAIVTANMFRQTTIVECSAVFVLAGVVRLEWLRPLAVNGFCHRSSARHKPTAALHRLALSPAGSASAVRPFTLRVP